MARSPIPVVDLFAGPGGLAEGFATAMGGFDRPAFEVCLSVEKETWAHETLELRSFVRAFGNQIPDQYQHYLSGLISKRQLLTDPRFSEELSRAKAEACLLTLGPDSREEISRRVRNL